MNWIYTNNTNAPVIYRSELWLPNEAREVSFPVPNTLGLTCIQEGTTPDPVLFHDDVTVQAGEQVSLNINPPNISHAVSLSVQCMTPSAGCQCRFNHESNTAIPIDARAFIHTMDWENCSRILLSNPTDTEAVISVTAIEAVS